MSLMKKAAAEVFGTFVLVFFACGTAIVSGGNWVATALSFGLVIVAMAYTIGNISGCHINPAVSLGVLVQQKLTGKKDFGVMEFCVYLLAQFIGAIAGAAALFGILKGTYTDLPAYATNSVLIKDAGGYIAAFAAEIIMTLVFVYVILVVVNNEKTQKKAGLLIGFTLTLVHLLGIGITGTSVNPARSFGPALMQLAFGGGSGALGVIWVFLLAPLVGGFLAALLYKCFHTVKDTQPGMTKVE